MLKWSAIVFLGVVALLAGLVLHWRVLYTSEVQYMLEFCRAEAVIKLSGERDDLSDISCVIEGHEEMVRFKVLGTENLRLDCLKTDAFIGPTPLRDCDFYQ